MQACHQKNVGLAEPGEAQVQDKQDAILQFLTKLAASHLTGPKVTELCHCTFEMQDLKLAQHIRSLLNFKHKFKNSRLTPLDMSALAFIIFSGQDLTHLNFAGCLMDWLEVLSSCKNTEQLRANNENKSMCSLQDRWIQDPEVKRKVVDLFSRMAKLKKNDASADPGALGPRGSRPLFRRPGPRRREGPGDPSGLRGRPSMAAPDITAHPPAPPSSGR
ncbi:LOW QUALITY PROTEIN: protein NLRC5 [Phaethornis superciliosus]